MRSIVEHHQLTHPTGAAGRSPIIPNRNPIQNRRRPHTNHVDADDPPMDDVDFSGMSLHHLPDASINFAAISKLNLSNNNLQMIPESVIARMLNVEELDLHSNQVESLPNSIGCLSKLRVLNVSANLLQSFPPSIENCKSLEEVSANFNNLTSLPETIGFELTNLQKLSINSNKIVFLPFSTSHLTQLRILDVRLNCLKSLPEDLHTLTSLQTLNVSQNFQHLSHLPDSIGLLSSLIQLDISYNNISSLPPSLSCLRSLQTLCVDGNPLVSPPIDVVHLGLHTVRTYLADKMNSGPPKKEKRSWFGRLKRHGTSNARPSNAGGSVPNFLKNNPIEAIASPRHFATMLSPSRWFSSSPQHSFSRLS